MNDFTKHYHFESLSREILLSLVDKIYVDKDKNVTIDFLYKDKYSSVIKFITNIVKEEVYQVG